MSCTICSHPQRRAIDQALVAGSATLAELAKQYNLSTSALHRHKAHLKAKVNRAQAKLQANLRQGCIFWLSQALDMAMQVAQTAQTEGDSNLVLRALAQGTRLATIILKQDLPLDDQVVHAMLTSPEWSGQAGLFPNDPKLMALSRESLGSLFSTPCPDEPPPALPAAAPAGPAPHALATALFPSPSRTRPKNQNRQSNPGDQLAKWKKGGKLPGYECYEMDEEEQYRILELDKKLAGLDLEAITRGLSPAAASAKEDEICQQLWDAIPIPKDKPLSEYIYELSLEANQEANRPGNGQGGPKKAI
jgi:hypothetical protein